MALPSWDFVPFVVDRFVFACSETELRYGARSQRLPQSHNLPWPLRHRLGERVLRAINHFSDDIRRIIVRFDHSFSQSG